VRISFSNTVTSVSKQDFPYALIPVFLSRAFRHSAIFIRTDRGIKRPEDLKGKTVGLQEYDMTAAVVVRGFLRDQYRVERAISPGRSGSSSAPSRSNFHSDATRGRQHRNSAAGQEPGGSSACGRVGCGHRPAPAGGLSSRRSADRAAVSRSDRGRKGVVRGRRHFPIMHAVGVRKPLLDAYPGLGRRLFDAFDRAKGIAVAELEITQAPKVTLPWPHAALAEARALFGPDPWPYGVRANRQVLETQLRWSRLDGLQARPVTLDELFAPDCLDT